MNTNTADIRNDQSQEGRSRTLTARPGHVGSRNSAPRKQFIAKGHDAILKDLQDNGSSVEIYLISSEVPVAGTLVARDKFTITLQTLEGRRTFYKHAIESFMPISKVQ